MKQETPKGLFKLPEGTATLTEDIPISCKRKLPREGKDRLTVDMPVSLKRKVENDAADSGLSVSEYVRETLANCQRE